jgi:hypothetical protein
MRNKGIGHKTRKNFEKLRHLATIFFFQILLTDNLHSLGRSIAQVQEKSGQNDRKPLARILPGAVLLVLGQPEELLQRLVLLQNLLPALEAVKAQVSQNSADLKKCFPGFKKRFDVSVSAGIMGKNVIKSKNIFL